MCVWGGGGVAGCPHVYRPPSLTTDLEDSSCACACACMCACVMVCMHARVLHIECPHVCHPPPLPASPCPRCFEASVPRSRWWWKDRQTTSSSSCLPMTVTSSTGACVWVGGWGGTAEPCGWVGWVGGGLLDEGLGPVGCVAGSAVCGRTHHSTPLQAVAPSRPPPRTPTTPETPIPPPTTTTPCPETLHPETRNPKPIPP